MNDATGSKRGGRALRIIGGGLLGLLVLSAGGAMAFTNTSLGANWVADKITHGYGEQIKGSVQLGRVEGSLAQGIEMGELELRDRDGRPLFTMDELRLELSLMAALRGELRDVALEVDGVTVIMPAEGEPGFADIRPKGRDREERERKDGEQGEGPSLQAKLALSEIKVVQRPTPEASLEETELLGRLESASAQVSHQGDEGEMTLAVVMQAPAVENLDVRDLQVAASWRGEKLSVGPISADTNWGQASLASLAFDPTQKSIELGETQLEVDSGFFEKQTGISTSKRPKVEAKGRLGLQGTDFHVQADLAEGGTLQAKLKQAEGADLLVHYDLQAQLPMSRWQPEASLEQIELSGKGKLETIALGTWQVVGDLDCRGCETGKLDGDAAEASAHLDAKVSALQGSALASMEAAVAGTELELKLSSGKEGGAKLTGQLTSKEHGRFDAWLARLGVPTPTHETDDLKIECGGEGIGALACHVVAEGKDLQVTLLELPTAIIGAMGVGKGEPSPPSGEQLAQAGVAVDDPPAAE